MFGLNVTYTMKPGKRDEFLAMVAACDLQAAVLQEEGCFGYHYFVSVGDPDELLLVERWTNQAAQQTHLTQPHMAQMPAIKEVCVAQTTLVTYEL